MLLGGTEINISLHASWTNANVVAKDYSNTWATVFSGLNSKSIIALPTSSEYTGHLMAGYFVRATLSNGTSLVGYYNASAEYLTSGTATSSGVYYRMIQNYDANKMYTAGTQYYYMVTRDTNIVYLTGNITNSWASAQNKPFTFTGLYNGIDYGNSYIWNISSTYVVAYADTVIENLRIESSQSITPTGTSISPATNMTTNRYIYGNSKNLRIGRGVRSPNSSTCSAFGVIGGTPSGSASGSATNLNRYNFVVESGTYIFSIMTNTTGTANLYVNMYATYGSDYDRVKADNSKMDVRFVASGHWGGVIRGATTTDKALNLTVKSGSFGSSKIDHTTGIYVGGRGSTGANFHVARCIKVEGGWIYNMIGGPLSDTSRSTLNDIYMHVTGGEVDMIFGGAGETATYGNRIIAITGGRVNYSVMAGSNGYTGGNGTGTVNGSGFIYVGGNAQIGNPTYVANNNVLYTNNNNTGIEAGSIFGIGNGNTQYNTIGSSDNSNIIIGGDAHVLRNVYGGR